MRKLLCAFLVLWLCAAAALGEAQDPLEELSLEELYALRERVEERIALLETSHSPEFYPPGSYRVGEDMPAGVYFLYSDAIAILPTVLVRTDEDALEEELFYEVVTTTAVMRFVPGCLVTLTDVTAYPFDSAPQVGLDENGAIGEGGYWVGEQIPAGDYQVVPLDIPTTASFTVYDDLPGARAQVLRFEVIYAPAEVSLEEGQYISLTACSLQLL